MKNKISKEMDRALRAQREVIRLNEELKKRDAAARTLLDSHAAVIALLIERNGGKLMVDPEKYEASFRETMENGVRYNIRKTKKYVVFEMKTDEEPGGDTEGGKDGPTEDENGEENSGEKADA